MDVLKVKWNKSAFRLFMQIVNWYSCNVGQKAAINVTQDFFNTIHHISLHPEIGMFDKKRSTSKNLQKFSNTSQISFDVWTDEDDRQNCGYSL
jgi:hypothetical protein